jgi:hypothetical protein
MKEINKSKKRTIDKLRLILDNPNVVTENGRDDKYLDSIRSRMIGTYKFYQFSHEPIVKEDQLLQPQVTIHEGKSTEISKDVEEKSLISKDEELEEFKEILFEDEELFEIERVDKDIPEFTEFKQKDKIDIDSESNLDEELPEWEPVEDNITEFNEEISEFTVVETESVQSIKNDEDLIIEDESHHIKKEKKSIENIEKKKIFEEFNSVNDDVAIKLYDDGYDSIYKLQKANIKDLTKIKGINKRLAKKIKDEIEKDLEWESIEDEVISDDNIKGLSEGWESIEDEDKIKDEKNVEVRDIEPEFNVKENQESEKFKGYKYKQYRLFKKNVDIGSGQTRTVHFFSKINPKDGIPIGLPEGYEVKENLKTGVPYLRKKK